VTMFHAYDIRLGLEKGKEVYKYLLKNGDCFLSISDYDYRNLLIFGVDPKKIVMHPVGIDVKRFPFCPSTGQKRAADQPIKILSIGRLAEVKGFGGGIMAIFELFKKDPSINIEYNIIGMGPLKESLQAAVKELDLEGVIHFLGEKKREDVIKALVESDIYFLPSTHEALPMVLMEAQAVGLPVVATDVGSTTEIVLDAQSGFIVPEGDIGEMAERLGYLIQYPDLWPEMGKTGREYVKKHYDINMLNDKLVEIYRELV
ncbi:MAG: glycosyltransferase, partial [Candidatus Omnitrophica bacterium]|nr:glycosyltransferase [Candidatus Omnitrophota bacterium]